MAPACGLRAWMVTSVGAESSFTNRGKRSRVCDAGDGS
jgi:hypothetical protein